MSIFYHEEEPPNPCAKRCKFVPAALKDAFSSCHTCSGRLSNSSLEDYPGSVYDEQQEDEVVSEIRSRALEKLNRKPGPVSDNFSWLLFSPTTGELHIAPKGCHVDDDEDDEEEEREEFLSVKSCFTRCSSSDCRDAFFSVKTKFSRCSSLNGIDFNQLEGLDYSRRLSIIKELCHCEGWPFGLCRKALLLPPLPKSPSESWTWHKGSRAVKRPFV